MILMRRTFEDWDAPIPAGALLPVNRKGRIIDRRRLAKTMAEADLCRMGNLVFLQSRMAVDRIEVKLPACLNSLPGAQVRAFRRWEKSLKRGNGRIPKYTRKFGRFAVLLASRYPDNVFNPRATKGTGSCLVEVNRQLIRVLAHVDPAHSEFRHDREMHSASTLVGNLAVMEHLVPSLYWSHRLINNNDERRAALALLIAFVQATKGLPWKKT